MPFRFINLNVISRRFYNYEVKNTDKKKRFPFKSITSLAIVSSGGLLIYAYYNRQGRLKIEKTLPITKSVFDYLIGDVDRNAHNEGYFLKLGHTFNDYFDDTLKKLNSLKVKVSENLDIIPNGSVNEKSKKEEKTKLDKIYIEPKVLSNVDNDINFSLKKSKDISIAKANEAAKLTHNYIDCLYDLNIGLKYLLEKTNLTADEENKKWDDIAKLQDYKSDLEKKKDKALNILKVELSNYENLLKKGQQENILDQVSYKENKKQLESIGKTFNMLQEDLEEAESKSRTYLHSFKLLRQSHNQLDKELKAIHPKFEFGKWTLLGTDYTKEDLSTLLVHAYKKINLFQKELAKEKSESIENLSRLLKEQKDKLIKQYANEMKGIIDREKENFTAEKRKEIALIQEEFERKLSSNVDDQSQHFQEKVNALLTQQREELVRVNENQIKDIWAEERVKNDALRQEYLYKMEGIERALTGTFEARKEFLNTSKLWVFSSTLLQLLDGYHPENAVAFEEASNLMPELKQNSQDIDEIVDSLEREIPFIAITTHLAKHLHDVLPSLSSFNRKKTPHQNVDQEDSDIAVLNTIAQSFSKLQNTTREENDSSRNDETPQQLTYVTNTNNIQTLKNLTERWNNVQRVCRRVAMINDPDSSLLRYFFSYIQSFFVIQPSLSHIRALTYVRDHSSPADKSVGNEEDRNKISENKDDSAPIAAGRDDGGDGATEKLKDILRRDLRFEGDTFETLALADYYVREKRDLLMAVKILNLLKGLPRLVADGWIRDTQTHLEVAQNLKLIRAFSLYLGTRETIIDQNVLTVNEKKKVKTATRHHN